MEDRSIDRGNAELGALSLRAVTCRLRPLFAHAANAGLFLDGLLGNERAGRGGWEARLR